MAGDEDVVDDKPGTCRKCGMTLEPIRLVSVWTCSAQPGLVTREQPGKCPVDGSNLVQMTMAVSWTCAGSKTESVTPGQCPDGSLMKPQYKLRPHGNHNPQHGGQFFMAPDNWHHLEGTYPRAGLFRMYLYDDYTKPLPRDQARKVSAQVVVQGQSFPLTLVQNGRYLEARIGTTKLPATVQAKLKFQADAPQHVFDFSFDKYSRETTVGPPMVTKTKPTPPTAQPTSAPVVAAPPTARSAADFGSGAAPVPSGIDPALIPLPIPDTVPEMLAQLRTRTDQIKGFIDKGMLAEVYVPAFQAKDLALALATHEDQLSPESRHVADPAIARLVRSAYLLDAFGDLGNKQQIAAAYVQFAAAAHDIQSAFPGR